MATTLVIKGVNFSANKLTTVELDDRVPCTGISLNYQTSELNSIGETLQLVATCLPVDTTDVVVWSSSNPSVATIANGLVTVVSLGETIITATCGSQTATCTITVDNVTPNYVAVCGYTPYCRSAGASHATTDKKSSATSNGYIVAANQATGLYPIESKPDVDTSPFRFVPILIPQGATKIKVTNSLGNFYTRFLFFDSTKKETFANTGAYCVYGLSSGWEQSSSVPGPVEMEIPSNISGLDSFCIAIGSGGSVPYGTSGNDYLQEIKIEFLVS